MATEVAALRLVRERTTVPVPRVLWSDTSCRRLPSPLFVMDHCPGRLLSELRPMIDAGQQQFVDAQVAGFLRQMNSITHTSFGRQAPSAPTFARWSSAFVALFDDALADGEAASVELPVASETIRALTRESGDRARRGDRRPASCIGICGTRTSSSTQTRSASLASSTSNGRSGADPLMEGQFFAKSDDATFLDAYGQAMLTTAGSRRRRLLYDLYLFVIMTVEVSYRRYPTDDIERFARAAPCADVGEVGPRLTALPRPIAAVSSPGGGVTMARTAPRRGPDGWRCGPPGTAPVGSVCGRRGTGPCRRGSARPPRSPPARHGTGERRPRRSGTSGTRRPRSAARGPARRSPDPDRRRPPGSGRRWCRPRRPGPPGPSSACSSARSAASPAVPARAAGRRGR